MKYLLILLTASSLHAQCVSVSPGSPSIPPPYTLPVAEVGNNYSFQFQGTSGQPPYQFFSYQNRPIPSGLTLETSGLLSGRPTLAKPDDIITIIVRDARFTEANICEFRIAVIPNRLAITSSTLPRATVGSPYSATLAVAFGTAPFRFELLSGAYPPGIQGFSNGVLSGTPTAPGTSTLRFRVIDANNNSATADITLIVDGPTLRFETSSLPNGEVGLPYTTTLRLTGNPVNPTFQLTSGTLPPGLTLQNNTIAGTPNTPGTFNFNIRATTSSGTADAPLSIRIAASTQPLTLQDLPRSTFVLGLPVNTRFPTIGGQGTVSYALVNGILPAGLDFSATGEITGTPRGRAGIYGMDWRAFDSTNATSTRNYAITIQAPIAFPPAVAGQRYSQRLPGTARYTVAPFSRLPLGLIINPDGTLTGTPFAAGEYTFALRKEDPPLPVINEGYSLTVAAPPTDLELETLDFPNMLLGTPIRYPIVSTPPATSVQLLDGALPPGLSIQNNAIAGTPTATGYYEFLLDIRSGTRSTSRRFAISTENPNLPAITAITNAASYDGPSATPGQIITLFGSNLDNIRALLDTGIPHVLYSTPNQAAVILPHSTPPDSAAKLTFIRGTREAIPFTLRIIPSRPGIFTQDSSGQGPAAALNEDASLNTTQNPAAQGSIVILYGTGLGPVDQPVVNGQATTAANPATAYRSGQLSATVNGLPATILYAGVAPGLIAGVDQLNIQLPPNLPSGQARLKLTVNSRESNEVLINVR